MGVVVPDSCYPLRWPSGFPRTTGRIRSSFKMTDPGPQIDEVYREIGLIPGVRAIILSSNMPTRADGTPSSTRATQAPGGDPGVVAYWTRVVWRAGANHLIPYCVPVDRWDRIACNLHALALSIASMRGIERWGAVSIEQAFSAFAALPAGSSDEPRERPWREVLGGTWPEELDSTEMLMLAKGRHRKALQEAHPDRGGDPTIAAELNVAIERAERELGGVA